MLLSGLRRPRKKWTEVLADAEARNERHDHNEQSNVVTATRLKSRSASNSNDSNTIKFQRAIAARFIAKRLGPLIRDKISSGRLTCSKSIENLQEPSVVATWQKHWEKSSFCFSCFRPAVYDIVPCALCNNVIHRLCLRNDGAVQDTKPYLDDNNKIQKASKLAVQLYQRRDLYYCDTCQETMKAEIDHHNSIYERLMRARINRAYGLIIAHRVLTHMRRSYFKRMRKALILWQSLIRKMVSSRRVVAMRRQILRNVIIELRDLPPITRSGGKGLVVLTSIDPVTRAQLFRVEKSLEKADTESFLVPGINANATIAVTLCYARPEDLNSYVMLAQAQLARRTDKDFMKQRSYSMVFSDSIKWVPQDVKTQSCEQLLPQNPSNYVDITNLLKDISDLASLSSLGRESVESSARQGSRLLPSRRKIVAGEGMQLASLGPDPGLLPRSATPGTAAAGPSILAAQHRYADHSTTTIVNAATDSSSAAWTANNDDGSSSSLMHHHDQNDLLSVLSDPWLPNNMENMLSCELHYCPLKPFRHFCQNITAPQLGYLKRPPEVSAALNIKKTKSNASTAGALQLLTTRMSVWWISLVGAKLYFFQFYGDPAPRLISDVIDASAIQGRDKNGDKTGFVSLIHKDARMWPMLFPTVASADEFVSAIAAMRKLVDENQSGPNPYQNQKENQKESSSLTLRAQGIIEPEEFGFFCPIH